MVAGQSHRSRRKFLAVVLEVLPELRPAHLRRSADENVRVIDRLLVLDPVLIPGVTGQPAGFEVLVHELPAEADYDERLRLRITIAAIPERIHAADCARQTVFRTIEVDCSRFAVIRADNAEMSAFFGPE